MEPKLERYKARPLSPFSWHPWNAPPSASKPSPAVSFCYPSEPIARSRPERTTSSNFDHVAICSMQGTHPLVQHRRSLTNPELLLRYPLRPTEESVHDRELGEDKHAFCAGSLGRRHTLPAPVPSLEPNYVRSDTAPSSSNFAHTVCPSPSQPHQRYGFSQPLCLEGANETPGHVPTPIIAPEANAWANHASRPIGMGREPNHQSVAAGIPNHVRLPLEPAFMQQAPQTIVPWNPPPPPPPPPSPWIPTPNEQNAVETPASSCTQVHRTLPITHSSSSSFPKESAHIFKPSSANPQGRESSVATIHLAGRHDARHLHRPESTSGPIRNHRLVGNKSFSITGERTEMPVVRAAGGGIGIVRKGGGDSGGPKRKPLPKIYGCDVCGKKFDRPSTLKVHEAIHSGAKDHLCEYCQRAFTVQSNMKRHMRVCKHKPLSPPLKLHYFLCAAPAINSFLPSSDHGSQAITSTSSEIIASGSHGPFLPAHTNGSVRTASVVYGTIVVTRPSMSVDRANRLPFDSQPPNQHMIQTPDGNVQMLPYGYEYATPSEAHRASSFSSTVAPPPRTVKGHKAPMIIAAMFSVQQNVPNSIAKFTLVQLQCEVPLRPVRPAAKYQSWYYRTFPPVPVPVPTPAPSAAPMMSDRDHAAVDVYINFDGEAETSTPMKASSSSSQPPSHTSSSSLSAFSSDPSTPSSARKSEPKNDVEAESANGDNTGSETIAIDRSIRAEGLAALPSDLFEERDSYFPRTRYCYHPAEYDPVAILPGPGVVDLPIMDEDEE